MPSPVILLDEFSSDPQTPVVLKNPGIDPWKATYDRMPQWSLAADQLLLYAARGGFPEIIQHLFRELTPPQETLSVNLRNLRTQLLVAWVSNFLLSGDLNQINCFGETVCWLLKGGADPNKIVLTNLLEMDIASAFTIFMFHGANVLYEDSQTQAWESTLQAFLRCHANLKARFLCIFDDDKLHSLRFPVLRYGGPNTVLVELGYPHFTQYEDFFRDSGLASKSSGALPDLYDLEGAPPAKALLLVRQSINGLSAKPILSIEDSDAVLICKGFVMHSSQIIRSIPRKKDSVWATKDLSKIYESYESEELDALGIVEWLVQHGHLPSDVLPCGDPMGFLLRPWRHEKHHRSEVDFSYRPQYDRLSKAFQERISYECREIEAQWLSS